MGLIGLSLPRMAQETRRPCSVLAPDEEESLQLKTSYGLCPDGRRPVPTQTRTVTEPTLTADSLTSNPREAEANRATLGSQGPVILFLSDVIDSPGVSSLFLSLHPPLNGY